LFLTIKTSKRKIMNNLQEIMADAVLGGVPAQYVVRALESHLRACTDQLRRQGFVSRLACEAWRTRVAIAELKQGCAPEQTLVARSSLVPPYVKNFQATAPTTFPRLHGRLAERALA
jgi:hypothetical protein